jgi:CHRD domain/PEP-CTERM motif
MKTATLVAVAALLFGMTAFAGPITYFAGLLGSNEVPPTGSPASGFATVTVDSLLNTMLVNVTFTGLEAGVTASHIHCCIGPGGNAGVATTTPTFTGFPSGVTSGTYSHVFDLTLSSSYNPAFVTAEGSLANAEAALLAGMAADQTYLNIHSTVFPGGEIRGFLVPAPEPGTFLLAGAVLAGLLIRRK